MYQTLKMTSPYISRLLPLLHIDVLRKFSTSSFMARQRVSLNNNFKFSIRPKPVEVSQQQNTFESAGQDSMRREIYPERKHNAQHKRSNVFGNKYNKNQAKYSSQHFEEDYLDHDETGLHTNFNEKNQRTSESQYSYNRQNSASNIPTNEHLETTASDYLHVIRKPYKPFNQEKPRNMDNSHNREDEYFETSGMDDIHAVKRTVYETRNGKRRKHQRSKAKIHKPELPGSMRGDEVLFGIHPAILALTSQRRTLYKVFVKSYRSNQRLSEIEELAARCNVTVEKASTGFLDKISGGRPHQGVCINVGTLSFENFSLVEGEKSISTLLDMPVLWLVLDGVVDPMNFGAVLRTAHYLGIDKVFTVRGKSCPLTPVVSKASSGTMEVMKIYQIPHLLRFLEELRARGWCVAGTSGWVDEHMIAPDEILTTEGEVEHVTCEPGKKHITAAPGFQPITSTPGCDPTTSAPEGEHVISTQNVEQLTSVREGECEQFTPPLKGEDFARENKRTRPPVMDVKNFKFTKPTVLVIGNEAKGIRSSVWPVCDCTLVVSPQLSVHQGIQSLNVSVATGILLHSLLGSSSHSSGL